MKYIFFVYFSLFCVFFVVTRTATTSVQQESTRDECHSFYDYVCSDKDIETPKASTDRYHPYSYFGYLREKHENVVTKYVQTTRLYGACMIGRRGLFVSKTDADLPFRKYQDKRYSYYAQAWTMDRLLLSSYGASGKHFPVVLSLMKRLDADEVCIDLSPDQEWLKRAEKTIDDPEFRRKFMKGHSRASDLIDYVSEFVSKLMITYRRTENDLYDAWITSMEKDPAFNPTLDYFRSYTSIGSYGFFRNDYKKNLRTNQESESSLSSAFWKSTLMSFFEIDADDFCMHANYHENFYDVVYEYVAGSKSDVDFDFLVLYEEFARHIMYGSFGQSFQNMERKPTSSTQTLEEIDHDCIELVKEIAIPAINDAFLMASGLEKSFVDDNSVTNMVEKLKLSLKNVLSNSTKASPSVIDYGTKKLNNMKTFVLNRIPKDTARLRQIRECVEEMDRPPREITTKSHKRVSSDTIFEDFANCFASLKNDQDKAVLRRAVSLSSIASPNYGNQREPKYSYSRSFDYDQRYLYLYDRTDISIVNAWYDPTQNEITVPAAIVFWPMYAGTVYGVSNMYDYSRMGMILGHELGHSVDNNGLCWDQRGNYDVTGKFCGYGKVPDDMKNEMICMVEDYGHPCGEDDDYGDKTLGEDIADQLGVTVSWNVFISEYGDVLRLEDKRDFFRKYAMLWCDGKHYKNSVKTSIYSSSYNRNTSPHRSKISFSKVIYSFEKRKYEKKDDDTEYKWMCEQIKNDVHALPKHRVNKTLRQFSPFKETFSCAKNSPMVNDQPCKVY
jgi:hypothetical protein